MKKVFGIGLVCCTLWASAVPNFQDLSQTEDAVFFLSTPKSGTNWISASLTAITRKPISWLKWHETVFNPKHKRKEHPSYNRLGLPLVSEEPLMYRTHFEYEELRQIPSQRNRLIFVTRNPKELLYRSFWLQSPGRHPDREFVETFLNDYLKAFRIYESWCPEHRFLVYYEDFIVQGDEILLQLLQFMGEPAVFWDDFVSHREEYMSRLLDSYKKQHVCNLGGQSSRNGPKPIYYSLNAAKEVLDFVDEYLVRVEPEIWERYLKRFQR